jgi:ubiquinone/menaquinone biosynthesis C-methylase UbiE
MASPSPAARALYALHHRAVHVPRVERVTRALAAQIGHAASLLDIGCGDGTVALGIGAAIGAARIAGVDVLVRPETAIPVTPYDGEHLPFADGAFEAVVISDVLHHCEHPAIVLREALRVASRVVAIKDHFRFDRLSNAILLAMDQVGNAGPGVLVRGTYFSAGEWTTLVREAGGQITGLEWPLRIHDLPWRLITQDRLQFVAKIQHVGPRS